MERRFQTIYSQTEDQHGQHKIKIIKDVKTGVLYLCDENMTYQSGGVGLVALVDRNGKPLTDTYQVTI